MPTSFHTQEDTLIGDNVGFGSGWMCVLQNCFLVQHALGRLILDVVWSGVHVCMCVRVLMNQWVGGRE